MKQLKKIWSFIILTLTVISAIITSYQFLKKKIVELEIKNIDNIQLTRIPDIDGLTVEYQYRDSLVKNLWKMRYIISNVGSQTIIAKGTNKNIIMEFLSISFSDSVKILSANIDDANFPISIMENNSINILSLDFKQWKQSEFIDIIAIVENFGLSKPFVTIDERDIIDSKIIYSEFYPNELNDKIKMIDYLPKSFANALVWIVIIYYVSMVLVILIGIFTGNNDDGTPITSSILVVIIVIISIILFLLPLLWII